MNVVTSSRLQVRLAISIIPQNLERTPSLKESTKHARLYKRIPYVAHCSAALIR
jgi:hypothetical protein